MVNNTFKHVFRFAFGDLHLALERNVEDKAAVQQQGQARGGGVAVVCGGLRAATLTGRGVELQA
eukprot:8246337-Alexandrium_andersonii.AAC.1